VPGPRWSMPRDSYNFASDGRVATQWALHWARVTTGWPGGERCPTKRIRVGEDLAPRGGEALGWGVGGGTRLTGDGQPGRERFCRLLIVAGLKASLFRRNGSSYYARGPAHVAFWAR